jgi:NAD-dependent dihydropyrimidine dehydrogenase PreA subunit
MSLKLKPSAALLNVYKKECEEACSNYNYWWSIKAGLTWNGKWQYDNCVQKCINKIIEEEKPDTTTTIKQIVINGS